MYAIYGLPFTINIPPMLAFGYHTYGSYGYGSLFQTLRHLSIPNCFDGDWLVDLIFSPIFLFLFLSWTMEAAAPRQCWKLDQHVPNMWYANIWAPYMWCIYIYTIYIYYIYTIYIYTIYIYYIYIHNIYIYICIYTQYIYICIKKDAQLCDHCMMAAKMLLVFPLGETLIPSPSATSSEDQVPWDHRNGSLTTLD